MSIWSEGNNTGPATAACGTSITEATSEPLKQMFCKGGVAGKCLAKCHRFQVQVARGTDYFVISERKQRPKR